MIDEPFACNIAYRRVFGYIDKQKSAVFSTICTFYLHICKKSCIFRHAPSLNKFRVGIHSESTVASSGTYAKGAQKMKTGKPLTECPTMSFMCKHLRS